MEKQTLNVDNDDDGNDELYVLFYFIGFYSGCVWWESADFIGYILTSGSVEKFVEISGMEDQNSVNSCKDI